MRNRTGKGIGFTWFGYFEDSGLDTQVSITSFLATEAFIHLHLWKSQLRRAGLGTEFVRRSAAFYFERFNLQKLVCEPWAENPAPNRVLEKLGFAFVRRYRTIPGVIAFEQEVNRYELRRPDQMLEPA